jgi:hypothetical protein
MTIHTQWTDRQTESTVFCELTIIVVLPGLAWPGLAWPATRECPMRFTPEPNHWLWSDSPKMPNTSDEINIYITL